MGTAIAAVVGVAGAAMQSRAAGKAAEAQAGGYAESAATVKQSADTARADVMRIIPPAMEDYVKQLENQKDLLVRGESDVLSLLRQTTSAADQIITQSGADVQKLIMGASATRRGVPREVFERQYQAGAVPGQTATPTQYQQAGIGGTPQALPAATATPILSEGGQVGTTGPVGMGDFVEGQVGQAGGLGAGTFEAVPLTDVQGVGPQGAFIQTPYRAPVEAMPGTGYIQAREDLEGARDISRAGIEAGRGAALGQLARGEQFLTEAERRGLEQTQPYTEAGAQAAQREAALSGALGPEAQQQAIDEFIESPGQKFLRQRQEQALLRSQAATGGLGGGRVLTALQEQAMGLAATQQQQQLANLGTIAGRGAGLAAGDQRLIAGTGAGLAGLTSQAAGIETTAAQDLMRIESIYGPQVANLAMQTGLRLADVQQMTDQQRAALVQSLGSGAAGVRAGTIQDIAGLSAGLGATGISQANYLANLLSNIGVGAGSNVAQYQAQQGEAQAAGTIAAARAQSQGLTSLGQAAGRLYDQYGGGYNWGGLGGSTATLPSNIQGGSAPIINPYTNQIQGGM